MFLEVMVVAVAAMLIQLCQTLMMVVMLRSTTKGWLMSIPVTLCFYQIMLSCCSLKETFMELRNTIIVPLLQILKMVKSYCNMLNWSGSSTIIKTKH
uniref:Uncharacterized protein n=1 Tax=Rhizophora mucronata TaxID=61149 RepID=A0A2P2IQI3_RHIMU